MKKQRESNFELLRIIAMLMVIAGHLTQQSGILEQSLSFNKCFAVIFGSGSGIADNLFVMTGAWFLVDLEFRAERIVKLYAQVWTYCVPLTIIMPLFAPEYVGIKDIVRGLFPYSGSPLWFVSCYISMLLFSPFLNKLLLDRKVCKKVLILLFFINVIPSTFLFRNDFFYSGEFIWFIFLYLLIGYYKKYLIERNKWNKFLYLGSSFFIYILLVTMYFGVEVLINKFPGFNTLVESIDLQMYFITRYHTLPAFLCSILLFSFFSKLDIGSNKLINLSAQGVFAAYIIHQTPAFAKYMWDKIILVDKWINSVYYPIFFLLAVLGIYIIGCSVDFIRRKTIQDLILGSGG